MYSKLITPQTEKDTVNFSPPDVTHRVSDNLGDFILPSGIRHVTKTSSGTLDGDLQFTPTRTSVTGSEKVSVLHSSQQNMLSSFLKNQQVILKPKRSSYQ